MRWALVALLLLGCAACDSSIEGRVCLASDSNGSLGLGAYHFALAHGRVVGPPGGSMEFVSRTRSDLLVPVSSTPGARLSLALASGVLPGRFATAGVSCTQALVILGTNDVSDAGSPVGDALDAEIDQLMGFPALAGIPVLWVAPSPTAASHSQVLVQAWRAALWRAEQRWPLLEVYDAPTSWLDVDGIHFTPGGYVMLANEVADRLQSMVLP